MQFFSTRDQSRKVTASEAIAQGLSQEGGLFVPESFPQVDVQALCGLDYPTLAAEILKQYLTDYSPEFLTSATQQSYGSAFGGKAGAMAPVCPGTWALELWHGPTQYLTDYSPEFLTSATQQSYGSAFGGKAGAMAPVCPGTWALELWHGPTCAFKDYALQLMPKLLVEAKRNLGRTEQTRILVATSGDTGKAALDGYHDVPGVDIAVFYPTGGTSEIQRLQMATQEGANVAVYAVQGNFDDAQTGVKKVLQLMPKLLVEAKRNLGRTEQTRILVATSGDTGKAALDGYHDVPGVDIAVFYPTGGTSEIQRLQMATQEGANVAVYAVQGHFDDAQTGVKKVFGDPAVAAALAEKGVRLSSANSINWGRLVPQFVYYFAAYGQLLVPQIVYYFAAYGQLLRAGEISFGDHVDFCVPTGNFGDILAGYYAKRMGLPVGMLICASNENNVLTDFLSTGCYAARDFLSTGCYAARRTFYKTTSPSMDILVSSNLERLLYHITGSDAAVAGWMQNLNETGSYTVDKDTLAAIQQSFGCGWASEAEVCQEIRARYEQDGYQCDTHTAVAFHVAAQKKRENVPMVVLSTASPFKFPRSVLEALGHTAPENDFEAMSALEAATGRPAELWLRLGQRGRSVSGDPCPVRAGWLSVRYPYRRCVPCGSAEKAGDCADGGALYGIAFQVPPQCAGGFGPYGTGK